MALLFARRPSLIIIHAWVKVPDMRVIECSRYLYIVVLLFIAFVSPADLHLQCPRPGSRVLHLGLGGLGSWRVGVFLRPATGNATILLSFFYPLSFFSLSIVVISRAFPHQPLPCLISIILVVFVLSELFFSFLFCV